MLKGISHLPRQEHIRKLAGWKESWQAEKELPKTVKIHSCKCAHSSGLARSIHAKIVDRLQFSSIAKFTGDKLNVSHTIFIIILLYRGGQSVSPQPNSFKIIQKQVWHHSPFQGGWGEPASDSCYETAVLRDARCPRFPCPAPAPNVSWKMFFTADISGVYVVLSNRGSLSKEHRFPLWNKNLFPSLGKGSWQRDREESHRAFCCTLCPLSVLKKQTFSFLLVHP